MPPPKLLAMQRQQYKIDIQAPVDQVSDVMLGKDTYRLWTKVFHPTSDFEGGWNKGDKIYFTAIDKAGKKQGMIARIAEHIPGEFVSICHYGYLDDDQEITQGKEVEEWAGALENYHFNEQNGTTTVIVDLDTAADSVYHMNSSYPKALKQLKELCEV